jgi:hypothetical protein
MFRYIDIHTLIHVERAPAVEITLSPATAQRIQAALGDDADLSPGRIPTVLARLAVEAPAVYSQVLSEISGSQIRLDSERELQRRRRRGLLRRWLFWWGEYESDVGDRLLAKRPVAAAVPLGLAGIILILLVLSATLGHRTSPSQAHFAAAHGIQGTEAHMLSPDPGAVPERPAPGLGRPSISAGSGPVSVASVQPALLPPSPLVPAPGNPVVIELSAGPTVARVGTVTSAGISPIVYDRIAEERGAHPGTEDLSLPTASPERDLGTTTHPWVPGTRVPARLATGVVVVAGGSPMPVIAESADPVATWLGRATLGPEGLVQVSFALISPGTSGTVRAMAFDPARLIPGLLGSTTLRHPRAASAILSAALQATLDYVQALARQGQAPITDGWAQWIGGPPAPPWTFVAARLAQGLEPLGSGAVPVETTEIASGTPLVILVTEAS